MVLEGVNQVVQFSWDNIRNE